MKRLIFFFALLVHSLVAAECFRFGLDDIDSDAIVAGAVNASTGEYLESVTDMVVAAPDPLIIQRHYSSGKGSLNPNGWMFSHAVMLIVGKAGATFARLELSRNEMAARVEPSTLKLYDNLRSRRQGKAVARVEQGMCQGCRIVLPMNKLQQIKTGYSLVQCGSCDRILYLR